MKQEKSRIVIDSNEKNKMQIKLKSAPVVSGLATMIKRPLIIHYNRHQHRKSDDSISSSGDASTTAGAICKSWQ